MQTVVLWCPLHKRMTPYTVLESETPRCQICDAELPQVRLQEAERDQLSKIRSASVPTTEPPRH
jgi:hypothetical protein